MRTLNAAHLGPTSYRDGLRLQEALVAAISAARGAVPGLVSGVGGPDRGTLASAIHGSGSLAANSPADIPGLAGIRGCPRSGPPTPLTSPDSSTDWLLFPDHPPVLTVGRHPSEGNIRVPREALAERGIEVFEVARGGDVTWHGPGQLVGYTLCDLDVLGHDLHRFLRQLEAGLIDALATWGIAGERVEGRTGIWVGGEKIASIGVAVRRWVTYHGFALNLCSDLAGFELIHPCGLHGIRMTTVARQAGANAPTLEEARRVAAETVARALGYASPVWKPARAAWDAAAGHLGQAGTETPGRSHETESARGGAVSPTAA